MLKIEQIKLNPLEEYPEVAITLLPPSHKQKMEIGELLDLKDEEDENSHESRKASKEALYRLMVICIQNVEGIQVGENEVKTAEEFLELAPDEVFDPVLKECLKISGLSAEEEKKS